LFSRDTIESINEATLMYVLAYNILGPRPRTIPKEKPDARTYNELVGDLDAFGNAIVEVENSLPHFTFMNSLSAVSTSGAVTFSSRQQMTAQSASGGTSNL